MRVCFVLECSAAVGMGHFQRCSALAGAFRKFGFDVVFVHEVLGEKSLNLEALAAFLLPSDYLVIDHYSLAADWEIAISSSCRKVIVIDDLLRLHKCDLLVDQNYRLNYEIAEQSYSQAETILLGPKYALLRPEFAAARGGFAFKAALVFHHPAPDVPARRDIRTRSQYRE